MYTITNERRRDLHRLPAIELAAARLLEGQAPDSVLNGTLSVQELEIANSAGLLWLALKNDIPVGFACLEYLEAHRVHIKELDVHPDHGRRGLGTSLLSAVCEWARRQHVREITLTTFREVPFNMPFYQRFGFRVIDQERLDSTLISIVAGETARGLDPARRVVMHFRVAAFGDQA